ncbi:unnamed protein product [Brassicogethes aeneus]|uniref:Uncharacterized protein n=1 Tax=Brassicogethes aeneus TaxID=1431903 RepID=A0A9P0BK95_BRAAE|nr:unnamed protein product [Brassicogethes aeneus]
MMIKLCILILLSYFNTTQQSNVIDQSLVFFHNSIQYYDKTWEKVASSLCHKIICETLDISSNLYKANKYQVSEVPAVIYVSKNNSLTYHGFYDPDDIIDWALTNLKSIGRNVEVNQEMDDESFRRCIQKEICFILILPELFDCPRECRLNSLEVLKEVALEYGRYDWGYIWSEFWSQSELEEYFSIDFYYSTIIALVYKEKYYHMYNEVFSKCLIDDFVKNIVTGKVEKSFIHYEKLPKINSDVNKEL